jgi:hypothetical protein
MNSNNNTSMVTEEEPLSEVQEKQDYKTSDDDFLDVSLEHYKPWRFPTPTTIKALVTTLERNRLLVLNGEAEVNRSHLARHVAWYLQETKVSTPPPNTPISLLVKEWRRTSDSQRLLAEIQKTKKATIFLLTEVSPRDLIVNFHELQDAASPHNYIIVSSDIPWNAWDLPSTVETTFWHKLPHEGLFSFGDLAEALITRLLEVKELLPAELTIEAPDKALCGSITPLEIATQLKSLHRVQEFVSALRGKEGEVTEPWIIETLERIANKKSITIEEFFDQWYYFHLDPRSRLLALNLSFFDGAFEDQFFGALEALLAKVWREREPLIKAYDYDDLVPLDLFFDLVPTRLDDRVVQMRLPDQRYLLLKRVWFSHRRQIVAALPILVDMVKQSVRPRTLDRELYGTRSRRERLREAIGLTLSDIGRIDLTIVQPILLSLAADTNVGVQMVAAEAMARWRYYKQDQKLFDTLKEWQQSTRILDIIRLLLEARPSSENERAETYIRATVALAVGRAARYDPPNQLHSTLLEIFMDLAEDGNRRVRSRFKNHMLPNFIVRHHRQIQEQLSELACYPDLTRTIGTSLALAYQTIPEEVLKTLDAWHRKAISMPPTSHPVKERRKREKLNIREGLLAVVACTYGEIEYPIEPEDVEEANAKGLLTADKGFLYLKDLLHNEKHPVVRNEIVMGLVNQAKRDIRRVDNLLQHCMDDVIEAERDAIVVELTEIYMEQRAAVSGGTDHVVVHDHFYPVWDSGAERPTTAIEMTLQRWLKDPEYKAAQQIAAQAFIAFAGGLDRQLAEETQRLEDERIAMESGRTDDLSAVNLQTTPSPTVQRGWYATFAVWLATLNAPKHRRTIHNVLSEVSSEVSHKTIDVNSTTFVLDKWGQSSDTEIQQIGQRLKQTLWFLNHQRFVLGIIVISIMMFLCVLGQVF